MEAPAGGGEKWRAAERSTARNHDPLGASVPRVRLYRIGPRVENDNGSIDLTVECGIPLWYWNFEGYSPPELAQVTAYARLYPGSSGGLAMDLYGRTLTSIGGDLQDSCDVTSTSSSIQARYCVPDPLDSDQYVVTMMVNLPPRPDATNRNFINGFRLCFDMDGW